MTKMLLLETNSMKNMNYREITFSTFINYPSVVPHPLLTIIPEWHALCIKYIYDNSDLFVLNSDIIYSLKI